MINLLFTSFSFSDKIIRIDWLARIKMIIFTTRFLYLRNIIRKKIISCKKLNRNKFLRKKTKRYILEMNY